VIYLRAGLYAEGPSDYHFLLPLLDRLLRSIAANEFPGANEVEATRGIDSSGDAKSRADRIAAAVREHEDLIDLLVIHADADGDPEAARRDRVEPGIEAARTAIPGKPVPALGCVPVRAIEAWLLADARVFEQQLGLRVELPVAPERVLAPKAELEGRLARRARTIDPFVLFGEQVRFSELRRLPAFAAFEHELTEFVRSLDPARRVR
jgi:hypothetical protein